MSLDAGVSCTHLGKTYGEGDAVVHALDDVTLQFPAGRLTAVIGASGSGKSTLLHCIAGFDSPTTGESVVAGQRMQSMPAKLVPEFRRSTVGFVFQSHGLVPVLTVRENILLPYSLAGTEPDWGEFDEIVGELGLADRLEHMPDQLSGGQRQKTAIARVLLQKPRVVFADEPTGSLDVKSSDVVLSLLRDKIVGELGITVIMVTHNISAAMLADHVVALKDGKVIMDSPMSAVSKSDLEQAVSSSSGGSVEGGSL